MRAGHASSRTITAARWTWSGRRTARPASCSSSRRARKRSSRAGKPAAFKTYRIKSKGRKLVSGLSIGEAVVAGRVCLIDSPRDIDRFVDGAILVTRTTDPDWVPIMKRAAAIVTDHGGRTSHAAIVSREFGLPAIVGTGNATHVLHDEQEVTVSCAEGDEGFVYEGTADFEAEELDLGQHPGDAHQGHAQPRQSGGGVSLVAHAGRRRRARAHGIRRQQPHQGPSDGAGPLRHAQGRGRASERSPTLTAGYADKTEYFVDRLARGLARIAAAHHPNPVIVRMSDFKTNEYANLIGGAGFEPKEENPMLGFRGASRYYSPRYREGFALECRAIRRLRENMGFRNVIVMIPFCRSIKEADRVLAVMAENGLKRGTNGLQVYVMCEIPSNVILAKAFAERFDGFSIGSNDLTQLTLGVDRDSEELADLFDEQDDAVKWMISNVITEAHKSGAKVGLCGQAPSDHPEFAEFLVGLRHRLDVREPGQLHRREATGLRPPRREERSVAVLSG